MTIIDSFTQKLFNSGYKEEQIRRIVIAGIKGWRTKFKRCETEGRRVRRTARESLEKRIRTKLLGRTTLFKKRSGATKHRSGGGGQKKGSTKTGSTTTTTPKSVLFVD